MKTTIKTMMAFGIVMLMAITSCQKDPGPQGEKGDKGDQGVAGPTGATGPQGTPGTNGLNGTNGTNGINGTNGTNGVANITSTIITTSASNWTLYSSPINYWEAVMPLGAITSSVISGGTIQVFSLGGSSYLAMPLSLGNLQMNYGMSAGNVFFDVSLANNAVPSNPGSLQYKVVVIPPAIVKANPGFDWTNYDAIQARFNLTD